MEAAISPIMLPIPSNKVPRASRAINTFFLFILFPSSFVVLYPSLSARSTHGEEHSPFNQALEKSYHHSMSLNLDLDLDLHFPRNELRSSQDGCFTACVRRLDMVTGARVDGDGEVGGPNRGSRIVKFRPRIHVDVVDTAGEGDLIMTWYLLEGGFVIL